MRTRSGVTVWRGLRTSVVTFLWVGWHWLLAPVVGVLVFVPLVDVMAFWAVHFVG